MCWSNLWVICLIYNLVGNWVSKTIWLRWALDIARKYLLFRGRLRVIWRRRLWRALMRCWPRSRWAVRTESCLSKGWAKGDYCKFWTNANRTTSTLRKAAHSPTSTTTPNSTANWHKNVSRNTSTTTLWTQSCSTPCE